MASYCNLRGSAVQSVVYRATLIAVLACPLATLALSSAGASGWSLKMPQAWAIQSPAEKPDASLLADRANTFKDVATMPDRSTGPSSELRALPNRAEVAVIAAQDITEESRLRLEASSVAAVSELQSQHSELPIDDPGVSVPAIPVHPDAPTALSTRWLVLSQSVGQRWLLGTLVLGCRLASAWWNLRLLRRSAVQAEPELIGVCESLAARMNVTPPAIFRTPFLPSPCLAGLRKPSILLPENDYDLDVPA